MAWLARQLGGYGEAIDAKGQMKVHPDSPMENETDPRRRKNPRRRYSVDRFTQRKGGICGGEPDDAFLPGHHLLDVLGVKLREKGLISKARILFADGGLKSTETRSTWPKQRSIIKAALDEGLPVLARCSPPRHFVVLVGYEQVKGGIQFVINDPGTSKLRYRARGGPDAIPVAFFGRYVMPLETYWIIEPGERPTKQGSAGPAPGRRDPPPEPEPHEELNEPMP